MGSCRCGCRGSRRRCAGCLSNVCGSPGWPRGCRSRSSCRWQLVSRRRSIPSRGPSAAGSAACRCRPAGSGPVMSRVGRPRPGAASLDTADGPVEPGHRAGPVAAYDSVARAAGFAGRNAAQRGCISRRLGRGPARCCRGRQPQSLPSIARRRLDCPRTPGADHSESGCLPGR